MKHYVIGDVHGCGEELRALIGKIGPKSADKIILVGDVFDRARHGHLVYDLIRTYDMDVLLGNHELKMLNYLEGRRSWVPPHYTWALNNLYDHSISMGLIHGFLKALPLIKQYAAHEGAGGFLVAHAGVNPADPACEDLSYNVYGKLKADAPMPRPAPGDGQKYWWDDYTGPKTVYYGHLVTHDNLPRFRKILDEPLDRVVSVGLDTAVCHGGPLTAICVETGEVFQHRSGVDWYASLRDEFTTYGPPVIHPDIVGYRDELLCSH
jgi:serine/threonine protein phosphatase 1